MMWHIKQNLQVMIFFQCILRSLKILFSRQVDTWSFILTPVSARYSRSSNQLGPTRWSTFFGHHSDPSLTAFKCCLSINKQFDADPLLDWQGHHRVFTHASHPTDSLSPDPSTTHVYRKSFYIKKTNSHLDNSLLL